MSRTKELEREQVADHYDGDHCDSGHYGDRSAVAEGEVTDGARSATARRKRRDTAGSVSRATRSKSAQRALDRHAKRGAAKERSRENVKSPKANHDPRVTMRARLAEQLRRVPFVVPVLGLLVLGLGLSLWLSTTAAQDSYQLGLERETNQELLDRRDQLKREFESGDSAPELSDKATELGMIPASNPARMIVDAQGRPQILGEPMPADGRPMGTINPRHEPDPAENIDPDAVYDSLGLGNGDGNANEADPPADAEADNPGRGNPDNANAPVGEELPPVPVPDGVPAQPGGPAPNVLPPNGNPPSANSPDAR